MSDIEKLKADIQGGERPNLFRVKFHSPVALTSIDTTLNINAIVRKINRLVTSVSYPVDSESSPIVIQKNGKSFKISGSKQPIDSMNITYYMDEGQDILNYFVLWRNLIQDDLSGSGVSPSLYKSNYFEIVPLNLNLDEKIGTPYKGVFPTIIGKLEKNVDEIDTLQKLDVSYSIDERVKL